MNQDEFIIHVYCVTCTEYSALRQQQRIRRAGFAPAFTDEEVMAKPAESDHARTVWRVLRVTH